MTTRAQLESEREALADVLAYVRRQDAYIGSTDSTTADALTASIARVDALLSLSDEQAAYAHAKCIEHSWELHMSPLRDKPAYEANEKAMRVTAGLIRREPRGDV